MPKSINYYRTEKYRVFYTEPYFDVNLKYEIDWHKKHLKKLRKHAKKPHLFHKKRTAKKIEELETHHHKHHKEHVIDSIPFHEKILRDQEKRLEVIQKLIPKRIYNKLHKISTRYGGTPEYFVYEKETKNFFFVSHPPNEAQKTWINLVKDGYQICNVVILSEPKKAQHIW